MSRMRLTAAMDEEYKSEDSLRKRVSRALAGDDEKIKSVQKEIIEGLKKGPTKDLLENLFIFVSSALRHKLKISPEIIEIYVREGGDMNNVLGYENIPDSIWGIYNKNLEKGVPTVFSRIHPVFYPEVPESTWKIMGGKIKENPFLVQQISPSEIPEKMLHFIKDGLKENTWPEDKKYKNVSKILTERLDRIASELEQAGRPDMALALDMVSDLLDRRKADQGDKIASEMFVIKNSKGWNLHFDQKAPHKLRFSPHHAPDIFFSKTDAEKKLKEIESYSEFSEGPFKIVPQQ